MAKLWRCEICGDPYVGDAPPTNCPFCGAKAKYIREAKEADVYFDVETNRYYAILNVDGKSIELNEGE